MPRVISYTPSWLSRPSPGFDLFASKSKASTRATNGPSNVTEYSGPHRTIACRGSEIFVAAGNEIRWSDLVLLQETGSAQKFSQSHPQAAQTASQDEIRPYRVSANNTTKYQSCLIISFKLLKVTIHGPIRQLVISPQGEYMAVVTAHTIYIAVLPDPSHLNTEDTSPLKLKTFQLGPTAHVLEQSSIASVIWHPLGYRGRCLVTVTNDAVVRLWELNRADRSTFSEPTLAVDLKKLANATSADENLSASKYGASKGFSPDSFELEVAAASFGGSLNQEGIHGWAPMTLWVAMKEGDVYALCPLLPSRWQLKKTPSASTFMQSLMASIHSKYASTQENLTASADDRRTSRQQLSWLLDITCQEPLIEGEFFEETMEVYSRPASTPSIPKLQGPFTLAPDFGEDFELTDIIISGLKILDEDKGDGRKDGIPASVVCLLTSNCDVHICLDLDGIEGQWLPSGRACFHPRL